MKHYYSAPEKKMLQCLISRTLDIKQNGVRNIKPGNGKTILLLFFNPSLRTRLSTQKAAMNLGMDVICMNVSDSWQLEFEDGVVMNLDKPEHIKDAAKVISQYVDMIGVRSFPGLQHQQEDYEDRVLNSFIQYSDVPVINLESSVLHPLQSLADMATIEEHKTKLKNKIVVSWAPHPKALPQAVVNSFLQFSNLTDYEVILTHPPGYELHEDYVSHVSLEYDQEKAFEGADFVYAKNWSSFNKYGKLLEVPKCWMIDQQKMKLTNEAKFMHCLPIRRNVVASDEVLDHDNSLIYQQAKNRMFAAQAVIEKILNHI